MHLKLDRHNFLSLLAMVDNAIYHGNKRAREAFTTIVTMPHPRVLQGLSEFRATFQSTPAQPLVVYSR